MPTHPSPDTNVTPRRRGTRLREYSLLDGAWRDEFVYGLLAREWRRSER